MKMMKVSGFLHETGLSAEFMILILVKLVAKQFSYINAMLIGIQKLNIISTNSIKRHLSGRLIRGPDFMS